MPARPETAATLALHWLGLACLLAGQPLLPRCPAATISQDQTWQGRIEITEELLIDGATVTALPGTTIVFSPPQADRLVRLRVGRAGGGGRLILHGTQDRPIIVRAASDAVRACLLVESNSTQAFSARAVRFDRLGRAQPNQPESAEPAITIRIGPAAVGVALQACRFQRCSTVRLHLRGQASATIRQCRFAATAGRTAVECLGSSTAAKQIAANRLDAGLLASCPNLLIENNVLVGPYAAIAVPTSGLAPMTIRSNFVHNSTDRDDGRYALMCYEPEALVAENVLIGGTYVVETASRRFLDNVLVGAAGLRGKLSATTTTHYLIANLPAGALVRGNLLLGPAYAMLATSVGARNVRIEHNTFDGWDRALGGICLNVLAGEPVAAHVQANVFCRLKGPALHDRSGRSDVLASWSDNLLAAVGQTARGIELPTEQPVMPDLDGLRFSHPLSQWPAEWERGLLDARLTVAALRAKLVSAYRPLPDSPLATQRQGQAEPRGYVGAVAPARP